MTTTTATTMMMGTTTRRAGSGAGPSNGGLSARALLAQRARGGTRGAKVGAASHRVAADRARRGTCNQGPPLLDGARDVCAARDLPLVPLAHALQNRVGELYSLVQFLRVDPYCYYFCKDKCGCDCKCRELSFDADYRYCEYCGHTPLQHYSLFNRDIVNPIRKFGYVGAGRTGFLALKRGVLDRILLRRTKAGRADEMVLPPKVVTIEANFLDAKESDFYQAIYTQSMAQLARTCRPAPC